MTETKKPSSANFSRNYFSQEGVLCEDGPNNNVLDLRLRYVNEMGWLDPDRNSDWDGYDNYGTGTVHISHRAANGELVAAMRLTPVDSLEESISFVEMIGDDMAYRQSVEEKLARQTSYAEYTPQLWDLTRLVHDTSRKKSRQILPAFLEMFGAGLAATMPAEGSSADAWWIFITTNKMRRTLSVCGIDFEELGQSSSNDSGHEMSYCCLVKPTEAMERLRKEPKLQSIYQTVKSGFDRTQGIE